MKRVLGMLVALGTTVSPLIVSAHEFSPHNVFLAYLKLAEPTSLTPYISIYEERFAPKVVGPQNEFSKVTTIGDAEKILAKNLQTFDATESFTIPVSASFGEYDFDKKVFDFRPITAATAFNSGDRPWKGSGDIQVVFINTKDFYGLPMNPAEAEIFVKKNGRSVAIDVEFVPVTALEGSEKIRAKIVKIDVYADSGRKKLIHTMMAPSS